MQCHGNARHISLLSICTCNCAYNTCDALPAIFTCVTHTLQYSEMPAHRQTTAPTAHWKTTPSGIKHLPRKDTGRATCNTCSSVKTIHTKTKQLRSTADQADKRSKKERQHKPVQHASVVAMRCCKGFGNVLRCYLRCNHRCQSKTQALCVSAFDHLRVANALPWLQKTQHVSPALAANWTPEVL